MKCLEKYNDTIGKTIKGVHLFDDSWISLIFNDNTYLILACDDDEVFICSENSIDDNRIGVALNVFSEDEVNINRLIKLIKKTNENKANYENELNELRRKNAK